MFFSANELMGMLQGYYWPFLRISALLLAAPVFGAATFPVRARVILAVLVAALVAPSLPAMPVIDVLGPEGILTAGKQVLIGLAMGFTIQITFASLVIAGQSLAMTMGLGFAMSVDPQNGVQVPVLSQLYVILSTLIFVVVDGHLVLLQIVAESFTLLPISSGLAQGSFALNVALWGGQMFAGGLLLALPALTAVLLINISFGIVTRAAPQLNIFAVGFPVTILVGFLFILLSLPSTLSLLTNLIEIGLDQSLGLVR